MKGMRRYGTYSLAMVIEAGVQQASVTVPKNMTFRANRFYCDVKGPGIGRIDALTTSQDVSPLLNASVDAWLFAMSRITAERHAMLEKHALLQLTPQQVDDYLDEHGLTLPDIMTVVFPTLRSGERIIVTGEFKERVTFAFTGPTL